MNLVEKYADRIAAIQAGVPGKSLNVDLLASALGSIEKKILGDSFTDAHVIEVLTGPIPDNIGSEYPREMYLQAQIRKAAAGEPGGPGSSVEVENLKRQLAAETARADGLAAEVQRLRDEVNTLTAERDALKTAGEQGGQAHTV